MATKFAYLETGHLTTESTGEVSIQSLIDSSDALAEEAREVLPYSFDECTYSKGYLRQAIWSCVDCGEKGVCYGCSISCHAEHKLVELWTKRNFRCDCPTTSMASTGTSSKRCKITPSDQQPYLDNEDNQYTHNFKGEFCRCGRDYDPETETEAMIQCIACEDWYHETCLNLRTGDIQPEGDEEDDEARVLIPSDTYDGLICAACVEGNEYLRKQRGEVGWMTIVPEGNEYRVKGRLEVKAVDAPMENVKRERGAEEESEQNKRVKLDETAIEDPLQQLTGPKDVKLSQPETNHDTEAAPSDTPQPLGAPVVSLKDNGDIFLADGIREKLQAELDASTIASLPFDLIDREIYEPPQDDDEDETLDEVTNRVMNNLPRVQAIEALHGYQNMKDRLMGMLRGHVANGETVRKEDIETFFAGLKGSRG